MQQTTFKAHAQAHKHILENAHTHAHTRQYNVLRSRMCGSATIKKHINPTTKHYYLIVLLFFLRESDNPFTISLVVCYATRSKNIQIYTNTNLPSNTHIPTQRTQTRNTSTHTRDGYPFILFRIDDKKKERCYSFLYLFYVFVCKLGLFTSILPGKPQQLFAHKCVLAARSPTFMRMFTGRAVEKEIAQVAITGECVVSDCCVIHWLCCVCLCI